MPALKLVVTATSEAAQNELKKIEALAKQMGLSAKSSLSAMTGHAKGFSGAMREVLVVMREVGRGNWTRLPGSLSILADQLGALKFLLTPFAGVLAGIAVAGYEVVKMSIDATEAAKNWAAATGMLGNSLKAQAEAMAENNRQAADFAEWLDKLDNKEDSISDQVNERLKLMREEFELKQRIAEQNGATIGQLNANAQSQRALELQMVRAGAAQAESNYDIDTQNAAQDEQQRKAFEDRNGARMNGLPGIVENARKVLQVVLDKSKYEPNTKRVQVGTDPQFGTPVYTSSPMTPGEIGNATRDVIVDGKKFSLSVNEAKQAYDSLTSELNSLTTSKGEINKQLKEDKSNAEKDRADAGRLNKQADDLQGEIGFHDKYDPMMHEKEKQKKLAGISGGHTSINALQRIGGDVGRFVPGHHPGQKGDSQTHVLLQQIHKDLIDLKKDNHPGSRSPRFGATHF